MTTLFASVGLSFSSAHESDHQVTTACRLLPARSSEIKTATHVADESSSDLVAVWNAPQNTAGTVGMRYQTAANETSSDVGAAWNAPQHRYTEKRLAFSLCSIARSTDSALLTHLAAERTKLVSTPQLGTDFYTIRPSEYDLRESSLLTNVTGQLNLRDGPYIPSAIIRIASYDLAQRPAMNIYSQTITLVHRPVETPPRVATPWGQGEPRYYTPGLPYIVEPPLIPGAPVLAPDIQETYITMHLVNIFALPGNEPLDASDIRLDLDKDSNSWRVQFDLHNVASAALVEPDLSGDKEVAIEINDWRWECVVSKVRETKTVDDDVSFTHRWSVTGFSRIQYLGAPYAPLRTRSIGSTTAVQAAASELDGTGFTLEWDTAKLTDWPMAGSSFSYQSMTPMQVIKRLASVAGGIVQPSFTDNTVTVRPRYWPLPWELSTSTPDHSISIHQVQAVDRWRDYRDLINAVYVSGDQGVSGAVARDVVRYGTAGDRPGSDVIEGWLTSHDVNVARGSQEIAGSGVRMMYSLTVEVPELASTEPGIPMPGETVALVFDDAADSFRAYVEAISISAPGRGLAAVRQTITLDRPVEWEEQ